MFKKKVGVLFGGFGDKTKTSIESKNFVLENLDPDKFIAVEIEISEENLFSIEGDLFSLYEVSEKVDIVFNCLCGKLAHDGKIQKGFELAGLDFVGSSSVTASISSNKELRKEVLDKFGIKTPAFEIVNISKDTETKKEALKLFSTLPQPCVFKRGSHEQLFSDFVCKDPKEIESVLMDIKSYGGGKVFVEEYLDGDNITVCGIKDYIDNSAELYFTPFNTESGESVETETGNQCMEEARKVFTNLGLSGHFFIGMNNSKRGVYVLDINNFPELTPNSIFVKLLDDYGIEPKDLITHLIESYL